MKLTILLPLVMSLIVLPTTGTAQGKDSQYKDAHYKETKSIEGQNKKNQNKQSKGKETKKSPGHHKSAPVKVVSHKTIVYRQHSVPQRKVYKTGAVVHKAPAKGISVNFGGVSFIFNDGFYYRYGHQGYTVVRPPSGLKIRYLPNGHEKVIVKGRSYYAVQGIYYVFDNGYYRVVEAPSGTIIRSTTILPTRSSNFQLGNRYSALPQGAASVTINGQQYFQYRDIYFLPQLSGQGIHYLAVRLN
ncbi:DUF6515 family protein [Neptuniibacter sp. 1_MG-2023]|uniref:DUF6515 family protein n=1 Tax=Neptuniibacter sp. 1_MG-2023 TaxID=3062662 RepID=UPI0026E47BFD|nr:DUF6515 family protein [Neptuniibacter sp. 1_MG-2023]MDO6592584.1 hypothetical protein [Neptuniibacter sp. 1_MG-2023]